jgi:hypothetical protein
LNSHLLFRWDLIWPSSSVSGHGHHLQPLESVSTNYHIGKSCIRSADLPINGSEVRTEPGVTEVPGPFYIPNIRGPESYSLGLKSNIRLCK